MLYFRGIKYKFMNVLFSNLFYLFNTTVKIVVLSSRRTHSMCTILVRHKHRIGGKILTLGLHLINDTMLI